MAIDAIVSDTVEKIKGKVQSKCGMPPSKQKLMFAGRVLKDGSILSQYCITNGSTVHLLLN